MKPEISIIVPVYNVEPYLRRCIDSIINQSMNDIEIVMVDDGSTDKSGEICDEYMKSDNRIKVIHQENGGLSHARNVGINQAQGKYIMFVDSDDYVEKDFCKIPYNIAEKLDIDFLMFDNSYSKNGVRNHRKDNYTDGIKTIQESLDIMLRHTGVAVWNKLFKKELLNGLSFPLGMFYEDCSFTYLYVLKSKKNYYVQRALYNYCFRDESITNKRSIKRYDYIVTYHKMFSDLKKLQYDCYIRPDVLRCSLRYLYTYGVNNDLSDMANDLVINYEDYNKLSRKSFALLCFYKNSKIVFYILHFLIAFLEMIEVHI